MQRTASQLRLMDSAASSSSRVESSSAEESSSLVESSSGEQESRRAVASAVPTLNIRAPGSFATGQALPAMPVHAAPEVEIFFDEIYSRISQWLDLRSYFSLALTDKAKWNLFGKTVQRDLAPLRKLAQLRAYQNPWIESAIRRAGRAGENWTNFLTGFGSAARKPKRAEEIAASMHLQFLDLRPRSRNIKETTLAALSALTDPGVKLEFLHLDLQTSCSDREILKALGKLLARAQTRIFIHLEFSVKHSEKLYRLLAQRQGPTHLECMFDWHSLPGKCRESCLMLARSGHLHGLHVAVDTTGMLPGATGQSAMDWAQLYQAQGIAHLTLAWAGYAHPRESIAGMIRQREDLQSLVLMSRTGLDEKDWEVLIPAIFQHKGLGMARVIDWPAEGGSTPSMRHLLQVPARRENNLCLEIGVLVTNWPHLLGMLRWNPDLTMLRLTNIGELDQASDPELARIMREHSLLELHIYSRCVTDPRTLRENHRHVLTALLDLPPHKKFFVHCPIQKIDPKFHAYSLQESPFHVSFCFSGGWHKEEEQDTDPGWFRQWLAEREPGE